MAERKTNRNAQTSKRGEAFQISREPLVQIVANDTGRDLNDNGGSPHKHGAQILFAIARDPQTIFASWTIDWPSLFEKILPADRQVHLRLYGADGLEEKSVAVEPMVATHYLTTSGLQTAYSVEIGYYQPADVWHSVATSQEIVMPPSAVAENVDVDLATIPFHVGFQELLNLFGSTNNSGLARVISQFQYGAFSIKEPVSGHQKQILQKLPSLSEMAAARRAFEQTNSARLAKRTGTLVASHASSPSRWSQARSASSAS
jgi:hypothetical protein